MNTRAPLVVLAWTIIPALAAAAPPHQPNLVEGGNLWVVSAYDDDSPYHRPTLIGGQFKEAEICFEYDLSPSPAAGTQQRYVWESLTFEDARGKARQEGDQVFMHGDFPVEIPGVGTIADVGHDSIQWSLVTDSSLLPSSETKALPVPRPRGEGTGHWIVWFETEDYGNTLIFANAKFRRKGYCRFPSLAERAELPIIRSTGWTE